MSSKLYFLLFCIFIFFFTITTFSSTKETNATNDFQSQNTQQDGEFPNKLNSISFKENNVPNSSLESSNILNANNSIISFDLSKIQEEESPSGLLNKLLKYPNLFQFIFPYLSLFELELNLKCISTFFYHLYEKFLQEEKNFLQSCLRNKEIFLEENIKHTRTYFDFFEKRFYGLPERIEFANVDYFSDDLVLLPKSIRQMISFKFDSSNNQYKYVVFKDGHLSILKQNMPGGNFIFTSLENDFQFEPSSLNTDYFQENVRRVNLIFDLRGSSYNISLYKKENLQQTIWHSESPSSKMIIHKPFVGNSVVFLKNMSGFLQQIGEVVTLVRFRKVGNALYRHTSTCRYFKLNVKEIKSKDFEHYAEEAQFIFL